MIAMIEIPTRDNPRNWTDDYKYENGNYLCTCSVCGQQFHGYKRRVVCKVCADTLFADKPLPTPPKETDNE